MTCHSGGTLEIYVEPFLPRPELLLVGHGPVIETLARLGADVDLAVIVLGSDAAGVELGRRTLTPRTSVVVATHGNFDEDALAQALGSEAGYVSLVASRRRAAVVVESLRQRGVPADRLGRLKAPAGLDIGSVTPQEIAVSILAEIVQVRRSQKEARPAAGPARAEAASPSLDSVDPVCGMRVEIASARYRSEHDGRVTYFCCLRCKETFDRDPARYARPE
jgi:xanthine dehydrogenase accessory factor